MDRMSTRLACLFCALAAQMVLHAEDVCCFVDPFVGTSGPGHTHPAASCPFGMVQAGPDTGCNDWAYCSGYQYSDTSVLGYSLTHLSGTGCPDYGDVQILPFTGDSVKAPMRRRIDKKSEKASPGTYRVIQPDDGLEIEIAAAKRAAIYRIAGGRDGEVKFLMNMTFGLGDHVYEEDVGKVNVRTSDAKVDVIGHRMVCGDHWRTGWISKRRVGYAIEFDRDWKRLERLPGALGTADEAPRYVAVFSVGPEPLLVKVAFSTVDGAGARANLRDSIPAWDFDLVREAARRQWNELLSRATCEGTDEQKRNWYTALYHLYLQPNDWADVDGRYRGADNRVAKSPDGTYLTTLSLWDTFRAAHPWYTIVTPEIVKPFVESVLAHYRAQGRIPVMSYGGKDVDCMVGNHAIPVLADAYLKGFRGFDEELLFEAITNTLTVAHPGKPKENWDLWSRYGYFPCDIIRGESVSRAFECAYDDYCAARCLMAMGRTSSAALFMKRAENWKNVFDVSIGLGRGKTSIGKWREPFDPYAFGHGAENDNDFTEGNAFQYTWHVMQNPQGLIDAMGGRESFVKKLDSIFVRPDRVEGADCVVDVTGLIGQYVHGNEPSHHVIYFYPQVGHPEKAAERIREVFDKFYLPKPDGLCGNDDCGQMSAWYLFSAMGFYPFNPCGGEYVLGAPQLPKVTIKLERIVGVGGRMQEKVGENSWSSRKEEQIPLSNSNSKLQLNPPTQNSNSNSNSNFFTIIAKNLSKENKYVKSVTLNGKPLTGWKIRHSDIMAGGELVFEMTAKKVIHKQKQVKGTNP